MRLFEEVTKQDKPDSNSHDILLASLALLVEVAKSDHDIEHIEQQEIIAHAVKTFGIAQEDQDALITQAEEVVNSSTSLYEYTSVINEKYSESQKYQLIYAMWRVAFSDGRIDRYEEHLIRKVADLIYIPHVKFIQAKHQASELKQG